MREIQRPMTRWMRALRHGFNGKRSARTATIASGGAILPVECHRAATRSPRRCRPTRITTMNAPHPAHHADRATVSPKELVGYEMVRKLVGFPTVSRDSNLALIEWVRDYLEGHGATTALTFDDEGRKANLFATLSAQDGNATIDGIVLSGHTDVVPVDGQPWDTDPFAATLVGDRLHGRGTADMKSFPAIGLAFVPEFVRRGLARPLHFALSYDEEVGCIGVRRLIADVVEQGVQPAGCIIGEPTGMQLVVANKGRRTWRCRVRGHEAHSSLTPQGVNAVQIACELVAWIANRARELRESDRHDPLYDVPFTTPHVGVIHGGTALNIVPRDCSFEFELRHLPFDDPDTFFAELRAYADSLLPGMQAVDPATYIAFDVLSEMPGFDNDGGDNPMREIGHACTGSDFEHKVSYGTEAALFHRASIPAVICGPGHIEQAHQPNEWIGLDQLARCEAFMRRLMDRVCAA
jgi:acetylornithine deacetylase